MSLNPSAMDRRLDPLRERTSTTFSSAWTELELMEFPSSADDNNPDPRRVKQSGMFVFGAPPAQRAAAPHVPTQVARLRHFPDSRRQMLAINIARAWLYEPLSTAARPSDSAKRQTRAQGSARLP
jgi:hypothetical protein